MKPFAIIILSVLFAVHANAQIEIVDMNERATCSYKGETVTIGSVIKKGQHIQFNGSRLVLKNKNNQSVILQNIEDKKLTYKFLKRSFKRRSLLNISSDFLTFLKQKYSSKKTNQEQSTTELVQEMGGGEYYEGPENLSFIQAGGKLEFIRIKDNSSKFVLDIRQVNEDNLNQKLLLEFRETEELYLPASQLSANQEYLWAIYKTSQKDEFISDENFAIQASRFYIITNE